MFKEFVGSESVKKKVRLWLKNYKEGYDDRDSVSKNYSIMSSISFRLSNLEMKALSEYLQGLY